MLYGVKMVPMEYCESGHPTSQQPKPSPFLHSLNYALLLGTTRNDDIRAGKSPTNSLFTVGGNLTAWPQSDDLA